MPKKMKRTKKRTFAIVTRDHAEASGLRRYFTGKPCSHGHVCERWVKHSWCVECAQAGIRWEGWEEEKKNSPPRPRVRRAPKLSPEQFEEARGTRDFTPEELACLDVK